MKILGVGLSKTGTTSLHRALSILGFRSLHYDERRLRDVVLGGSADADFRRYDDVDAVLDLPAAHYYEPLLAAYPEARAILTVRDEESWWRSIEAHFNERAPVAGPEQDPFKSALRTRVFGSTRAERSPYLERYRRHNARVRAVVPPDRLLVMDVAAGDGWERLCPFVGAEAPGVPFPHQNAAPGDDAAARERALGELDRVLEPGAAFVLVDEWWLAPDAPPGRTALPFASAEDGGGSPPADDATAIRSLERARRDGASHVVFTWPAFWWLDHYAGLARHLATRCRRSLCNDRLVVYDLRPGA